MDAYCQDLEIVDRHSPVKLLVIPRGCKIKRIEFLTAHVKIYYIDETVSKRTISRLIPYKELYLKGLLIS